MIDVRSMKRKRVNFPAIIISLFLRYTIILHLVAYLKL